MPKRLTKEEFETKAIAVHGDKYEYKEFNYVNNFTPSKIFCKKCNEYFKQAAHNHIDGRQGCPICSDHTKTKEKFIEDAIKIHGDKYDYKEFNYVNARTAGKIFCKKCQDYFFKTPSSHVTKKSGCQICLMRSKTKGIDKFIIDAKKIHGDEYNYKEFDYINSYTKGKIFCNGCGGYFDQSPSQHLGQRQGCPVCNDTRKTKEEFIEESKLIHHDNYNYEKFDYINSYTKGKIFCKRCKKFFNQTPHDHLKGSGCPFHSGGQVSRISQEWLNYENVPQEFRELKVKTILRSFKVDAVDFKKKIIWLFHGTIWHGNPEICNPNDINPISKISYDKLYKDTVKMEHALRLSGYELIIMWESDWQNFKKLIKQKGK